MADIGASIVAQVISGRHDTHVPVWLDGTDERVPVLIATHHWIVVVDRGHRLRAIQRDEMTPFHVVPARLLPTTDHIGRIRHLAVIRRRGIASVAEIATRTRERGGHMDAHVALAIVKAAMLGSVQPTSPETVEIDVDGEAIVFRDRAPRDDRADFYGVIAAWRSVQDHDLHAAALRQLLHLELTLEDPADEQRPLRMALKRLTAFARDIRCDEFIARLREIEAPDASPAEVANVVHGLFPERVAAERAFVEEASLLDWDAAARSARLRWP